MGTRHILYLTNETLVSLTAHGGGSPSARCSDHGRRAPGFRGARQEPAQRPDAPGDRPRRGGLPGRHGPAPGRADRDAVLARSSRRFSATPPTGTRSRRAARPTGAATTASCTPRSQRGNAAAVGGGARSPGGAFEGSIPPPCSAAGSSRSCAWFPARAAGHLHPRRRAAADVFPQPGDQVQPPHPVDLEEARRWADVSARSRAPGSTSTACAISRRRTGSRCAC